LWRAIDWLCVSRRLQLFLLPQFRQSLSLFFFCCFSVRAIDTNFDRNSFSKLVFVFLLLSKYKSNTTCTKTCRFSLQQINTQYRSQFHVKTKNAKLEKLENSHTKQRSLCATVIVQHVHKSLEHKFNAKSLLHVTQTGICFIFC